MKLYFGSTVTTVTTVMILALLGFMGYSIINRANVQYWGRRSLFLLVFGLVVCCFAAARDGLDKTIQYAIDGSCVPGIFPLVSVHWRAAHHCGGYRNAHSQTAAYTGGVVLPYVRRRNAENRDHGDRKDFGAVISKTGEKCSIMFGRWC